MGLYWPTLCQSGIFRGALKSLFGKIKNVFSEPEEESAEDIDRDVEAAVAAIAQQVTTSLEGGTVLHRSIGKAGDTVFVMDLNPMFAMIGGVNGRAAEGLTECCRRIFEQHRKHAMDQGRVEITKFIMRFGENNAEEGLHRAAIIVNEIGVHVLSDRFKTMEVPDILIAADAGDITDANGVLNVGKLDAVIAAGGKIIDMGKPADDDPEWVKLRYTKTVREQQLLAMKAEPSRGKNSPEWMDGVDLASSRDLKPRSARERRRARVSFGGHDQRAGSLERRGRGY